MNTPSATGISPAFLSVPVATTPPHKFQLQLVSSTINKQGIQLPKEHALLSIGINVVADNHSKHARNRNQLKLFASTSFSSSGSPVVEEVVSEEGGDEETTDDSFDDKSSPTSVSGCQACGKEEVERGCNGEGRIQGGIATVPGFGWWPIKAYRPCPSYVATGGRYRRTGQSMDEIGFGGGGDGAVRKASSAAENGENAQKRKRKFRSLGAESASSKS